MTRSRNFKDIPWNTLWLILTFILGSLGHAAMQYGSTSSRLDQINTQITGLTADFKQFYLRYEAADKATATELTRIQGEIDRLGGRVDKLEAH